MSGFNVLNKQKSRYCDLHYPDMEMEPKDATFLTISQGQVHQLAYAVPGAQCAAGVSGT